MGWARRLLQLQVTVMFYLRAAECLTFHTTEEQPEKTVIGNVKTSLRNITKNKALSPERLAELKFTLFVRGYPDSKHFTIGERTGEIRTKDVLDREALCREQVSPTCDLDIVVGVLSDKSNFYQVVPIVVRVYDINDNPPVFPKSILQVPIPESAPPGSRHLIPKATDRDIGNNTVKTYQLLTSSKLFTLKLEQNGQGQIEPFLVLNDVIDREKAEAYQLKVLALDGGQPPKVGSVTLNISVTDVNDHSPQFTQPRYEENYRENTKVGRTMLTVEATDSDGGLNGRVSYSFGPQTSQNIHRMFSINRDNGRIKLENKLNYEKQKQYQFFIKATDHGVPPKTAQTKVIINVEDVNDNAPSLHFNMLSAGEFSMLSENASRGSFIAHLSVEDSDHGRNGRVSCRVSPKGFILRRLHAKEYSVLLNRTLDRESWQNYNIQVTCQDGGNPAKTGSGNFRIEVIDVNDNPPLFQPPNYKRTLKENNSSGQFIIQVFARDRDAGENRNISYSLESHQNLFSIEQNGIINSKVRLDREEYPDIELIVVARDNGNPPMSSTAIVDITLQDVNDNRPVFSKDFDTFYVLEDEPVGSFVGRLQATDKDEGENGEVVYSLMMTQSSDIPFSIDPFDGTIKTLRELDRELQETYMLAVVAEDKGAIRQQSSIISIPVIVGDKNDNDPRFIFPNDTHNLVHMYHTAYVGTLVTVIKATDRDKGENGTISYRIVSGNDKHQFKIDRRSGEIFLVKELSVEDVDHHFLFISASDGGVPPKRRSAKLLVNVRLGNVTHSSSPSKGKGTAIDSMIIGISLALTAILLAIIIIVTIVILRIRRRKRSNEESARAEAEHMMSVSNSDHGGFGVTKSPKQNTLTKEDAVIQRAQLSLGPETPHTCHTAPNPTFSTFTGANTYMASIDHHNNMMYPQDAINIADRVPPDGQDIEMTLVRTRNNSPCNETAYSTLERDHAKRFSDVPQMPDVLQRLDTRSDISGETTASDSGRGGSEEETKHIINNNIKGSDKSGKCRVKKTKLGQPMRPVPTEEDTVNQRIKTWMADQQSPPPPYYSVMNHQNSQPPIQHLKPCQNPSVDLPIPDQGGRLCGPVISPGQTAPYKTMPSWRADSVLPVEHKSPKYSQPLILSSMKAGFQRHDTEEDSDVLNDSARDDDDGGTTTSGSYVVSPEDICDINELYTHEIPGVDV